MEYDLIIIGSGPGGISAAIYAMRANLNVLIIERGAPGGKLLNTHIVENYPGFKTGSGPELAMIMFNQLMDLKPNFKYEEVLKIKKDGKHKIVETNKNKYKTKIVVIATGMESKKLNIPGEKELYSKGLSYCVVCDGPLVKGKPIALIGGGNSAVEESLFASKISPQVYIIQYGDKLTAEARIIDTVKKVNNIKVITNAQTKRILGKDSVTGITYLDTKTNKEVSLEVSGVFPYIGYIPQTKFLDELKILTKYGFIDVDKNLESIHMRGIFAVGDIINKNVRQITTAVGDGSIVGQNASGYIINNF